MRKIKIFLTMLAVAGVLFATSSCVDDSESASVTDLRAKKSALLQAQANAAGVLAAAEALKADAELLRAQGEKAVNDAQAAQILAKTEAEKLKAEQDLLKLTSDVALAIAKNTASKDSLERQAAINLLALDAQLKIAQATANLAVKDTLAKLVAHYVTATKDLNEAKFSVISKSIELTEKKFALELFTVDSTKFVNNAYITANNDLVKQQALLVAKQKSLAEWESYLENENTAIAPLIAAKEAEITTLTGSLLGLGTKRDAAYWAWQDAQTIADSYWTDSVGAYKAITDDKSYFYALTSSSINVDVTSDTIWTYGSYEFVYKATGTKFYSFNIWENGISQTLLFYYSGSIPGTPTQNVYVSYVTKGTNNPTPYYKWLVVEQQYSYTSSDQTYASKEEYQNKFPLSEVKADSARWADSIKFYISQTTAVSAQLGALETAANNAKKDISAKKEALKTAQKTFYEKNPTARNKQDTININNAYVAVDGKGLFKDYPTTSIAIYHESNPAGNPTWVLPTVVVDIKAGAEGKANLAQAEYDNALYQLQVYKTNITVAWDQYYDAYWDLFDYNETIATLAKGPLVKLLDKYKALEAKAKDNEKIYDDAKAALTKVETAISQLYLDIFKLEQYEYQGLSTTINANAKPTAVKYGYLSKEDVQDEIDDATEKVNEAIALVAEYQQVVDNIVSFAKASDSKYYIDGNAESVAYVYAYLTEKLKQLEADIPILEYKVQVLLNKQQGYKAAIDALLAE
jgi:hypothetical protein